MVTTFKQVRCALCGNRSFMKLYTIRSFDILKCKRCGIIFANISLPDEEQTEFLQSIYTNAYFTGQGKSLSGDNFGYEKNYFEEKGLEQTHNAHRRLKIIEKMMPQKGRLLDIGCAAGFFLNVARERGWLPFGLELSDTAADFARTRFELDVVTGSFEHSYLPKQCYDVITAWDVIEHVLKPRIFIEKAYSLLKNNGLLVLGTPNVGSLAYKFRKNHWYHFKPPEHIFYYDPKTLKLLLKTLFDDVITSAQYPPYSKVNPTLKAKIKRVLYTGFNILAKIVRQEEYLIAYARKQ